MKSIYEIINETKNVDSVWTVKGPDGSIASVWDNEADAKKEADKLNKEVKGNVFNVEKDNTSEFVKEDIEL